MGGSFSDLGPSRLGCTVEADSAAKVMEMSGTSCCPGPAPRLRDKAGLLGLSRLSGRSCVGFEKQSVFITDKSSKQRSKPLSSASPTEEEIGEPLFLGAFRAGRSEPSGGNGHLASSNKHPWRRFVYENFSGLVIAL